MSDLGYIYVAENPIFRENFFKIGCTSRSLKVRMKELSKNTGVPDDFRPVYWEEIENHRQIEKMIHQKLANYRHRSDKEFFKLPLSEVIIRIQEITQRKIYQNLTTDENKRIDLQENMTLRWLCHTGDFIWHLRYFELSDLITSNLRPVDVWQCKEYDQVLISNKSGNDEFAINTEQYIKLDVGHYIDGFIMGMDDIYPGDKIAWIGKVKDKMTNQEDYNILALVDCFAFAKKVGFQKKQNILTIDHIPVPFGMDFDLSAEAQKVSIEAVNIIKGWGIPRTWIL
jgi:hypothetical protein